MKTVRRVEHGSKLLIGLAVIGLFAVAGSYLLRSSQAAPLSGVGNTGANVLSGNVTIFTDTSGASGPSTKFRPPNAPDDPTGLQVFVGGSSIALRWDSAKASVSPIKQYNIFRDGRQVGSATPGWHANFPEVNGNGFIDTAVTPGQTYAYQVQAVDSGDLSSSLSAPVRATQPAGAPFTPSYALDAGKDPGQLPWLQDSVLPFLQIWYPKIAYALALPDYTPRSSSIKLILDPTYSGVAYTSSYTLDIHFNPAYTLKNQQDLGAWLHESTHVLQAYAFRSIPSWITEGIADWPRDYMLHDRDLQPPPSGQLYSDGYGPAAYFLNWIQGTYDRQFIHQLNVAAHTGHYSDALFSQYTGKTIAQLWQHMTGQTLSGPGRLAFQGEKSGCVANAGAIDKADNPITFEGCNTSAGQQWTVIHNADATLTLRVQNGCLDARSSPTSSATLLEYGDCNGSQAERWRPQANHTLINQLAERCLADPSGGSVGAQLQLRDCTGDSSQTLNIP